MRKKMKLFIAMVSVGALLGTMPVMAAEQPELPTKVQDIANGSDELYGEGVPIEHGTNPDERFSSGGVDHTHQYIVANALKILSNDKGNSAFNGELNSSILMEATDWPDKLGNETDAGTFAGHFYDPDTGKNWLGQKSPTARTRAESYFQAAVNAYRAGDVQLAMSNLGKGTHYVSDLNEPHHASNLTAVNSNHSAFEKYVDNVSDIIFSEDMMGDIREFRDCIEKRFSLIATKERTGAELEELRILCEEFEAFYRDAAETLSEDLLDKLAQKDFEIHMKICQMSHNALYKITYQTMRTLLINYMKEIILTRKKMYDENHEMDKFLSSLKTHRLIYAAIRDQDTESCLKVLDNMINYEVLMNDNYL